MAGLYFKILKIRLKSVIGVLAVLAISAFSSTCAFSDSGVSTLPPPPAIAIANVMVAHHQYKGAVNKLNDVVSSSTYKNTAWAPEALYQSAHIEENNMHDDNTAVSLLNKIQNMTSYQSLSYKPGPAVVNAEVTALETKIDEANSHGFQWKFIDFFVKLTGSKSYSYWLALLIISVVVRLGLTPLTIKQYKGMREMQRLQPYIKELQAKYKDNKEVLGPKTMELYKEHGVNPAGGCIPLLFQLPIFWFMYQCVRMYQYHFTDGTFLWIGSSLHAKFPDYVAANLSQPDQVLIVLYAASMYVTQRMMPQTDPTQAEMQKTTALMTSMVFFFIFSQGHYASAFVLYWLISNIFSTATQMYYMRQGDTTSPAAKTVMPSDGAVLVNSSNGASPSKNSNNGSPRSMRSVQGTARGVIAPKVYPKKKRR